MPRRRKGDGVIKIAVVGAAGRMGQTLIRCCRRMKNVRLVAAIERPDSAHLWKDAGLVACAGETGVQISPDLLAAAEAEVLVDFSAHNVAPVTVEHAARSGQALVIGTTGLSPAAMKGLREAAKTVPVVQAPNMSLGVNVLLALVAEAAKVFGLDYDVEIVEFHHRFKKDAPSGTALKLAERIAEVRKQKLKDTLQHGRQGLIGERTPGEIGVHALRGGDVVGEHAVVFATEGERVEFHHKAGSRDAFAMGALRAAVWVAGRKPGLYDMQDVLGLR